MSTEFTNNLFRVVDKAVSNANAYMRLAASATAIALITNQLFGEKPR
ncbi:MAG: hypothetical protein K0Q63_543 [Paenibacillus sp.]|jgi:hypothetical protein|nr:hypothetical protein [Paenibacillus sp.]